MNITVVVWTTVMFVLFPACSGDNKNLAEAITERDSLPTMRTLGVTTLISDSGITRYKIITEEWEIYDKKKTALLGFRKRSLSGKIRFTVPYRCQHQSRYSLLLREKETLGTEKQCTYPQPSRGQI